MGVGVGWVWFAVFYAANQCVDQNGCGLPFFTRPIYVIYSHAIQKNRKTLRRTTTAEIKSGPGWVMVGCEKEWVWVFTRPISAIYSLCYTNQRYILTCKCAFKKCANVRSLRGQSTLYTHMQMRVQKMCKRAFATRPINVIYSHANARSKNVQMCVFYATNQRYILTCKCALAPFTCANVQMCKCTFSTRLLTRVFYATNHCWLL